MKFVMFVILLLANCLSFASFAQPSCYYSKNGQKVLGQLNFHRPQQQANGNVKPGHITFHELSKSKREKLSIEDLSAFVIGIDSFTVINKLKLQENQPKEVADIVQVLEKGKMNLYLHASRQGNKLPYRETYVLSLSGSNTYLCVYELSKQQTELASLFEASPRFKRLILEGKVKGEDIPQLVRAYNASGK